jgi:integrase
VGSIHRHRSKYQIRYYDPSGRRRARSFARLSDARAFERAIETDKRRGAWIDPSLGEIRFRDWVNTWRRTIIHLKPKTRAGYESLLRTHLLRAFGDSRLARIEPIHVREWIAQLSERRLSPSRIRQAYMLLSAILKAAEESGYLLKSPCVGIKLPRSNKREIQVLTSDQVRMLAAVTAEPYDVLIYVLAYGGLRWGEAAALRRARCNPLRARVEIAESLSEVNGELYFGETKSYAHRSVRLPQFVSDMLEVHLREHVGDGPEALVFTAPGGAPLRYSNFRTRVWRPAIKRAGDSLPPRLTPHHLRHTCASLLIRQGASVKVVQEQLGHSSPTVTLGIYTHLYDDDLDRLFELVDAAYRKSQEARDASEGSQMGATRAPQVVSALPT